MYGSSGFFILSCLAWIWAASWIIFSPTAGDYTWRWSRLSPLTWFLSLLRGKIPYNCWMHMISISFTGYYTETPIHPLFELARLLSEAGPKYGLVMVSRSVKRLKYERFHLWPRHCRYSALLYLIVLLLNVLGGAWRLRKIGKNLSV